MPTLTVETNRSRVRRVDMLPGYLRLMESISAELSIILLTYNHGALAGVAMRSVLTQRFDGRIEIVIADDGSDDDTRDHIAAAIRGVSTSVDFTIRWLGRSRNLGMQRNFRRALEACAGEFVALLEGDDYWSDPLKLDRQYNALRSNACLSACGHVTNELVRVGDEWLFSGRTVASKTEGILEMRNVLMGDFPHTSSLMFRRQYLATTPTWFDDLKMGDWPACALLASRGGIQMLPYAMSAYRSGVGVHSSIPAVLQWRRSVDCCAIMLEHLDVPRWMQSRALARVLILLSLSLLKSKRLLGAIRISTIAMARFIESIVLQALRSSRGRGWSDGGE